MSERCARVTPQIESASGLVPWPDLLLPKQILTLREFMLHQGTWQQLPAQLSRELVYQEESFPWHGFFEFVRGLPYKIHVDQQERVKVDQALVQAEESQKIFVGPDRYDPDRPLLEQRARAEEEGIQCQVTLHLYFETILGVRLPGKWRSAELFSDKNTRSVFKEDDLWQPGDIAFFHAKPAVDPRALHVTVCVGKDMAGVPWLLHATHYKNEEREVVDIWPLSRFFASSSFANLYDVRRIKDLESAQRLAFDRTDAASMV